MKLKQIVFLFITLFAVVSCDDAKEAGNLANCKFDYESITDVKLGDIMITEGMEMTEIAKILALLEGDSKVPLTCTFNVKVSNPNEDAASVDELRYDVKIDNISKQIANGKRTESISISGGQSLIVPLPMVIEDVASLLDDNDLKNAMTNLAKNFIGMGDKPTEFKLDITPTINILGIPVDSPVAIPVTFKYPKL